METFVFVRPEHLNQYGTLFGGQLLKWVDESAWLAAARDFPGRNLVTRAMDRVEFRTRVENGSILRLQSEREHQGCTSVTYVVRVWAQEPGSAEETMAFSTRVTFVCLGPDGAKCPIAAGP